MTLDSCSEPNHPILYLSKDLLLYNVFLCHTLSRTTQPSIRNTVGIAIFLKMEKSHLYYPPNH